MRERDLLAEIRAVRDELALRHGGDAWRLSRALAERSRLRAGGRAIRAAPTAAPPRCGSTTRNGSVHAARVCFCGLIRRCRCAEVTASRTA